MEAAPVRVGVMECGVGQLQLVKVSTVLLHSWRFKCLCIEIGPTASPPTTCSDLTNLANGTISYSPDVTPDYDLGTEATYTCEAGFYLEGNEVRVCMDDDGMDVIGVWSGQEPSCVRKLSSFLTKYNMCGIRLCVCVCVCLSV